MSAPALDWSKAARYAVIGVALGVIVAVVIINILL